MVVQTFSSLGGMVPIIAAGTASISSIVPRFKEAIPENLVLYLKFKENTQPEGIDYYLKKFYCDTALSASPHAFAPLQTLVDSSRIVFGTDYIFATQAIVPLTIKGIRECPGFTAKDIAAIERENAKDIFPRLKKS
jgi:predicted TIM-barrel fold metal-dependent hydrolase